MNIGIIGTGSMGTILIDSLIEAKAVTPSQLFIHNRTLEKAKALEQKYNSLHICESPNEVVRQSDLIFICVKPLQFHALLETIQQECYRNQLLVSITSPLSVEQLEKMVNCKVARAIPSILNRAHSGPSLLSFGSRCTTKDKEVLTSLLKNISTPLVIEENITRVASDIVSCGPAFFSYILQRFVDAAVRQTDITEEDATTLATNMIIGMGKLLEKEVFTLPTLQQRVCVPGGITGEGIKVLEEEIGQMFDHLFQQTHAKYKEDKEIIQQQFTSKTYKE
ncbi:late competence protein ComER [Alkalihalophilus pseudofirmus]|uniref:late competence protein ComER n=1 Tax=Alkalihalobacterium alkalinitrilicum TaxID=427920 RepID=UPI00094D35E9|nr:late competence protein ComER [Alkalihalobacterium alkalinitrilicum]OLO38855.1 late competence protein ComER [Alkalihalophilus pseudofirmus]